MRLWVSRHPFLMIGLATFTLFLVVEFGPQRLQAPPIVMPVLRVLLVPLWFMRALEMFLGMGAWPAIAQLLVALPLLFAPYVLADWVLTRVRPRRGSSVHAAAV